MNTAIRTLSLALVGLAGVSLGGPGSAQDTPGNQTAAVVASPPASAPAAAHSAAAAQPSDAAPTAAPSVSTAANADSNLAENEASGDDAAPEAPPAPLTRTRYTTAVLQALDKVTAQTLRFEAKVGEPVRYRDLVITVHDCEATAANEAPKDSIVHMDVQYQPAVLSGGASAVRQVFLGWMFADAPGLHPFVNPIYDVWVVACKTPVVAPATSEPGASL